MSEFVKCGLSQDLRQTTDATESPIPGCSFVSSGSGEDIRGLWPP